MKMFTPSKAVRVEKYDVVKGHPCIFAVLLIYENPALIMQTDGYINVYEIARYRVNSKVVRQYLATINRKYKCNITLRMIQQAYKANKPIYVSEIDEYYGVTEK